MVLGIGDRGSVFMADVFGEVQPHECEARNDKGPRRMPQPFGLNGLNLPATHAARPTAVDMAGGADGITLATGGAGCPAS